MISYILCINDHHQIYDRNMYMYTYKTYNSALLVTPLFFKNHRLRSFQLVKVIWDHIID